MALKKKAKGKKGRPKTSAIAKKREERRRQEQEEAKAKKSSETKAAEKEEKEETEEGENLEQEVPQFVMDETKPGFRCGNCKFRKLPMVDIDARKRKTAAFKEFALTHKCPFIDGFTDDNGDFREIREADGACDTFVLDENSVSEDFLKLRAKLVASTATLDKQYEECEMKIYDLQKELKNAREERDKLLPEYEKINKGVDPQELNLIEEIKRLERKKLRNRAKLEKFAGYKFGDIVNVEYICNSPLNKGKKFRIECEVVDVDKNREGGEVTVQMTSAYFDAHSSEEDFVNEFGTKRPKISHPRRVQPRTQIIIEDEEEDSDMSQDVSTLEAMDVPEDDDDAEASTSKEDDAEEAVHPSKRKNGSKAEDDVSWDDIPDDAEDDDDDDSDD